MPHTHERAGAAVRGASGLVFDAVSELTRIVEGMHANIAAASPPLGQGTDGRTRGITGFVYESIRQVNGAVGFGLGSALELLERAPFGEAPLPQPQWDSMLGVLNGVVGDHLVESANPLAIPMQLRRDGRAVAPGSAGGKLLVLIHGVCLNDRRWLREGHDHGAALARELGYTPVYLFYNSGRPIEENGAELARLLEQATAGSAVEEIAILGHSMGGLVARSAFETAIDAGLAWPKRLRQIVFLGTPHTGAPLERAGNRAQHLAELSPYLAPLARLGMLRSAGIADLRHGSAVALPEGVACYALAGAEDRLVPVRSALGEHRDPGRALSFPEGQQWVGAGLGHFDLLDGGEVYEVIRGWLSD